MRKGKEFQEEIDFDNEEVEMEEEIEEVEEEEELEFKDTDRVHETINNEDMGEYKLSEAEKNNIYRNFIDHVVNIFINSSASSNKCNIAKVSDEHGHSVSISFRENPHEVDILDGLYELCPKGMFKNKSDFNRMIFRMGAYILSKVLKAHIPDENRKLNELYDAHAKLMEIYKEGRRAELNQMFDNVRRQVIVNKVDVAEKLERIDSIQATMFDAIGTS